MLGDQRYLFDVPRDVAYLNCAFFGPRLVAVTDAGRDAIDRTAKPWVVSPADFFEPVEHLRSNVGALLGDDGEGVAIVPSISYGVAVAAANLAVGDGRSVVLLHEQFPSNVYPWRAKVARDGGAIVTVNRSADGWTAAILDAINERTRVVAVPHCHWTDGSVVDLVEVGRAARAVGAALVVDASQSLGAMPLDVKEIKPDFVASVGYKWQLGYYGLAYLWAADRHRSGQPLEEGWITRHEAEDFAGLVEYTDEYEPGARRFDMGERSNFIGVAMAVAATDQIREWGIGEIAETLREVTGRVADGAAQLGWEAAPENQRSPHLIGVRRMGGLPVGLAEALIAANVSVSIRGDSVRIAPHLHTTREDVDRLLTVLDAFS